MWNNITCDTLNNVDVFKYLGKKKNFLYISELSHVDINFNSGYSPDSSIL